TILLPAAFGVIGSYRGAGAEPVRRDVSPIDAAPLQRVGNRMGPSFRQPLVIGFLSRAFPACVAFDGDTPVGGIAFDNIGDLIDFVAAIAGQISAVKLEVYARQIDHDAAAGLFGFDI